VCFSQVRPNLRTAITIPHQSWKKFRDVLSDYVDGGSKSNITAVNGTAGDGIKNEEETKETKPVVNGDVPAAENVNNDGVNATAPAATS